MTRLRLVLTFLFLGVLGACATTAPHHATVAPFPARQVELPGIPTAAGSPKEARVVLETPGLKLAAITLRNGTTLPTHSAPVSVMIQALHGAGVVHANGAELAIDATHAALLPPGLPHSVDPTPGTDLVLLVHHLGNESEHHP
jgi:quercetin dioxygenase-like cupin family protein